MAMISWMYIYLQTHQVVKKKITLTYTNTQTHKSTSSCFFLFVKVHVAPSSQLECSRSSSPHHKTNRKDEDFSVILGTTLLLMCLSDVLTSVEESEGTGICPNRYLLRDKSRSSGTENHHLPREKEAVTGTG